MHESANVRRRVVVSSFSVYMTMSKKASESLRLASAESAASSSRINLVLVRILLADATFLVESASATALPGGYLDVNATK